MDATDPREQAPGVISLRDDPFPIEAVRDLLGLVRAIYAARREAGASPFALKRVAAVGDSLAIALDLAAKHPPHTMGHGAAWARAEQAALDAGELVDMLTAAEPIVRAATARVSGARATLRKKAADR